MERIVDRSTDRAMVYFKNNLAFQRALREQQLRFLKTDISGMTNDKPRNVYPQKPIFSGGTYINFGDNQIQAIINRESVCQVDKRCKQEKLLKYIQ